MTSTDALHPPHDPVPLHPVATEVVAQRPPGMFLESLALDSDGESWLLTGPLNQTVYRFRADGTTLIAANFDQCTVSFAFSCLCADGVLTVLDRLLVIDVTAVRSGPEWADGSFAEDVGFPTTAPPVIAELSGLGGTVRFGATNLVTTGLVAPSDTVAALGAAGAPTLAAGTAGPADGSVGAAYTNGVKKKITAALLKTI
jgi:hypothetical protein